MAPGRNRRSVSGSARSATRSISALDTAVSSAGRSEYDSVESLMDRISWADWDRLIAASRAAQRR